MSVRLCEEYVRNHSTSWWIPTRRDGPAVEELCHHYRSCIGSPLRSWRNPCICDQQSDWPAQNGLFKEMMKPCSPPWNKDPRRMGELKPLWMLLPAWFVLGPGFIDGPTASVEFDIEYKIPGFRVPLFLIRPTRASVDIEPGTQKYWRDQVIGAKSEDEPKWLKKARKKLALAIREQLPVVCRLPLFGERHNTSYALSAVPPDLDTKEYAVAYQGENKLSLPDAAEQVTKSDLPRVARCRAENCTSTIQISYETSAAFSYLCGNHTWAEVCASIQRDPEFRPPSATRVRGWGAFGKGSRGYGVDSFERSEGSPDQVRKALDAAPKDPCHRHRDAPDPRIELYVDVDHKEREIDFPLAERVNSLKVVEFHERTAATAESSYCAPAYSDFDGYSFKRVKSLTGDTTSYLVGRLADRLKRTKQRLNTTVAEMRTKPEGYASDKALRTKEQRDNFKTLRDTNASPRSDVTAKTRENFGPYWERRIKMGYLYDEKAEWTKITMVRLSDGTTGYVASEADEAQQMFRIQEIVFDQVKPENVYRGMDSEDKKNMSDNDTNRIEAINKYNGSVDFSRWESKWLEAAWTDRQPRFVVPSGQKVRVLLAPPEPRPDSSHTEEYVTSLHDYFTKRQAIIENEIVRQLGPRPEIQRRPTPSWCDPRYAGMVGAMLDVAEDAEPNPDYDSSVDLEKRKAIRDAVIEVWFPKADNPQQVEFPLLRQLAQAALSKNGVKEQIKQEIRAVFPDLPQVISELSA
jgi:hypothetical protein